MKSMRLLWQLSRISSTPGNSNAAPSMFTLERSAVMHKSPDLWFGRTLSFRSLCKGVAALVAWVGCKLQLAGCGLGHRPECCKAFTEASDWPPKPMASAIGLIRTTGS